MPALTQNGLAIVRVYYGSDERNPMQLVCYFHADGPDATPAATASLLASALDTSIGGQLKNCLCATSAYAGIAVLYHQGGVSYTGTGTDAAGVGVLDSDELPDYAAVCIRKLTEHGGRSGFGRWFLGAVPESFTDTDRTNNDGLIAYDNLADELIAETGAGGMAFTGHHYSRKDDAIYPISRTHVDKYLATQRRRRVQLPL